jgi:5-methylcytosine-specific restriction endonuclease McrA
MYYSTGNDDGAPATPGAVRRVSSSPGDGGESGRVLGTQQPQPQPAAAGTPGAGTLAELEALERVLLIREIRALEDLKGAIAAAQARAAAAFDASTRRAQAAAGLASDQLGKGVAAELALARRESPHHGANLLGLARILTTEMPHTLAALSQGVISEWRATLLVRETACLSLADRQEVDRQVAGNLAELEGLGDRKLINRIKSLSYGLDPHAVVNRAAHAVSERFVSCRPAPDTMTYLTALLPVAQGVGVYAALTREADRLRGAGDPRTKGQIMADTLVERATGQARAEDVRIEVQLIMTDQTLLHGILPTDTTTTSAGAGPGAEKARSGRGGDCTTGAGAGSGSRSAGHSRPWAGGDLEPGGEVRIPPEVRPEARPGPLASEEPATGGQSTSFVPDGAEPAVLTGYGIVPAQWARDLVRGPHPTEPEPKPKPEPDRPDGPATERGTPPTRPDPETEVWLRRLYIAPTSGQLTAMDSRARLVPHGLARLIAARDQVCRTPWCGAPIRHYDHITPVHAGGTTTAENIQGLCQACNQAKEAPGWESRATKTAKTAKTAGTVRTAAGVPAESDGPTGRSTPLHPNRHTVTTVTSTGHAYSSTAPRPPVPRPAW